MPLQPFLTFSICILTSLIGNELAHRHKRISRSGFGRLAIGLVSGFIGFLLMLMLRGALDLGYPYLTGGIFCLAYGYFMADARAFENIR